MRLWLLLVHLTLLLLSFVITAQTSSYTHKQSVRTYPSNTNSNEWTEKIAIDYFVPHKKSPRGGGGGGGISSCNSGDGRCTQDIRYYYRTHNTSRRNYNENLRSHHTRLRSNTPSVDHRTLIAIIANFHGYTNVECSAGSVNNSIFGDSDSVASFYRDQTHGKINFASSHEPVGYPNVVGPYTITISASDGCAPIKWAEKIEAAAYSHGINLDRYQHKMFIIPKIDVRFTICHLFNIYFI